MPVRLRDTLFLAALVALSLVPYVGGLGFNSDDWAFLGKLSTSPEQHNIVQLTQTLLSADAGFRPRPVEALYIASLYALFGLNPTGYHVVNGAVLALSAGLFSLVLRELGCTRVLATSSAAVYALLPNYSADRFWISASIAPLSVALYLLSLLVDLRLVGGRTARLWPWKGVSLLGLLAAGLAYELVIPLLPLNLVLMWRQARSKDFVRAHLALLFGANAVAILALIVFKLSTSYRVSMNEGYLEHLVYLVSGAVRANYVTFVAGMPVLTWWSLRGGLSAPLAIVALTLGLLVAGYVYAGLADDDLKRHVWPKLIVAGVFVSFWGYAVFLNNDNVVFATANVDTRTAIVATAGVALVLIGLIGWISSRLSARASKVVFSLCVSVLCLYGFLVVNRLATFWQAAYQADLNILYDINQQLPYVPQNTTLILDGTCPEIGPAFVFRFNWDLSGALATLYHDPTLKATVVTPDVQVDTSALLIRTFRNWDAYPYGTDLLVYDNRRKAVHELSDAGRARTYFETLRAAPTCPPPFSWLA